MVISGSSSGIGAATARLFAKEGAKIVLNSRTNKKDGESLAAELSKLTEATYVQANVGTPTGAETLVQAAIDRYGRIDIFINNAGTGKESAFLELEEAEVLELLQDNLLSTIYCSQAVIQKMTGQKGIAKIINTSSIRGWEFGGRAPVYSAAKAGVNALTRTLARMYGPNILINAVAPGFTKTPNYDSFSPEMVTSFLHQTTLQRWVTVEEVAEAYLFIARNDALTGEVIYVDAGFRVA